jgi:outer membrane protein OmpA-like peptidoglycan-associated protein
MLTVAKRCPPLVACAILLVACSTQKSKPAGDHAQAVRPKSQASAAAPTKAPVEHVKTPAALPAKKEGMPATEVGYYLDVLQGRLQQMLDPVVIVGRQPGSLVLDLSRRLGFAAQSAQIDDADRALLQPLAKVLEEYRLALVMVRVSTDDDAPDSRKLAQRRASAIAQVLIDAGVAAARVVSVVPDGMARDAHAEIVLAPETRHD